MKSGGVAEVLFVKPDDCSKFCDDNKNGLVYGKEVYGSDKARELFVVVKAHVDVDVVGGKLAELITRGVTRCVRVIWVDSDYTTHDLWKLAEGKIRKVEHIVDDTKTVEIDTNGKKTVKEVQFPCFQQPCYRVFQLMRRAVSNRHVPLLQDAGRRQLLRLAP